MNRRNFMKAFAAGIVASQMPIRGYDALASDTVVGGGAARTSALVDPDTLRSGGKFIIDPSGRTIGFTELGEKQGCTLNELYSYLKDTWKEDHGLLSEPFPMMGITPEYAEMENDWTMDMSRPAALRVGCIKELDGTKWASFVGLGTWEPDGLILQRDGKPHVEDVNPLHHMVKLTPEMRKLSWQAIVLDEQDPAHLSRKHSDTMQYLRSDLEYEPSMYDTQRLGIKNIYQETWGSIRFPIPHLPAKPSEVRRDVRNRINDNVMRRRSAGAGI